MATVAVSYENLGLIQMRLIRIPVDYWYRLKKDSIVDYGWKDWDWDSEFYVVIGDGTFPFSVGIYYFYYFFHLFFWIGRKRKRRDRNIGTG